jgi:hypothetical protein
VLFGAETLHAVHAAPDAPTGDRPIVRIDLAEHVPMSTLAAVPASTPAAARASAPAAARTTNRTTDLPEEGTR